VVSKFEGHPIHSQSGQRLISRVAELRHLNHFYTHILLSWINMKAQFLGCQGSLPSIVFLKQAFSNETRFPLSQEYVTLHQLPRAMA